MDDGDDSYLDFLSEGRSATLRGNPPGFDPHLSDQHNNFGNAPLTMAATPPDFTTRPRSYARRQDREHPSENPVEAYWKNNRPVLVKNEWSTIRAKLPVIAPTTAPTKVKNGIFTMLATRLEAAEGDWKDKAELFASLFNDQAPAANVEATLCINDMSDYITPVYDFADFALLDADYRDLGQGQGADYLVNTRTNCRFFKFTLVANPRAINTADFNVDAALFPSQVTTSVYV
jgi:hypothetical protein